jgi:glycerol-3-phosphate acyltransferase PlsX
LDKQIPEKQLETIADNLFALTHTAEQGGPIFGVDGVAVIGHGRSKAPQVTNIIQMAKMTVESNLVEEIKSELEKLKSEG